jgi:transmembrane sensor
VEELNNHIDELIGKYLSGEATKEESETVFAWIAENENNKRYFDHLKTIFARASAISRFQSFDADAAWLKMKPRLHSPSAGRTIEFSDREAKTKLFLKFAASVIVLCAIGFATYKFIQPAPAIQLITKATTQNDTLPDGTGVFLNKTTDLVYSVNKIKNEHVVKLKGEAFFNVSSKSEKSFLVDLGNVFIKDIGTAFNVKAYPDSATIEVFVEEGEVMFYSETDSGVYLKAGGKGVYDRRTSKFSIDKPDVNDIAYKTKSFIFADVELKQVAEALNGVYNEKIIIGDSLKHCRLSVNFNNENIEEIAHVIAETLSVSLERTANGYYLNGAGCAD